MRFFEEDIKQDKMYVLIDDGIIVAGFVLRDNHSANESMRKKYYRLMLKCGPNIREKDRT